MPHDRKRDIVKILNENGRVSVAHLAKTLYVSEMTIRRDLNQLEKQSIVKRYRGGAVLIQDSVEMSISRRFFVNEDSKKILGKEAAAYLKDDIVVYIDSSSTSQYVLPHIKEFKNIKVITNSLRAVHMAAKLQIPCVLIGGEYYLNDMCFVGTIAEQYARHFNVDVAFFSTMGLSADGIISDSDIGQTTIRKIVMENSAKNIFLFDENKLNKKYVYNLCIKDDVDDVITYFHEKTEHSVKK